MKIIFSICTLLLLSFGIYFWKQNETKQREQQRIERELSLRLEKERLEKERLEKERQEKQAILAELARLKELSDKRTAAREAVSGTKMDELQTIDGRVYKDVTIKVADAVGLAFQHTDGSARVNYEKLSPSLQQRFFYDPNETAAALTKEREEILRFEKMLEAADKENAKTAELQNADLANEQNQKIVRDLELMNTSIMNLEQKLVSLRQELSLDLSKAAGDRLDSKIGGISRAPMIREQISETEAQLNALRLKRSNVTSKLYSK